MNKAFNQKGKKSFVQAYPRAKFEFRSLILGRSKKRIAKESKSICELYLTYRARSYLD